MTGHYDPNQPRNKGGEWTGGGGKSGATTDTKGSGKVWPDKHPEGPEVRDVHVLQAADAAGVKNNKVRLALLDAHEKGHIKTHAELSKIAQHIAEHGDHEGTAVTAINVHGGGGGDYRVPSRPRPKTQRLLLQTERESIMRQTFTEPDRRRREGAVVRLIGLDRELARLS